MKKKIHIVLLIVVVFVILNITMPNYSYGFDGGKLMEPIFQFLATICDAVIDILQKILFNIEGDAFWCVDRVGNLFANIVGFVGAILFVAASVALAVMFAAPTGGSTVALILVGAKTAIMSIGKAVITFFAVSMLTEAVLPDTFYLPIISISPENILQNKIELLDVNFFDIDSTDEESESTSLILKKTIAKWYYTIRDIAIVCFMIILMYLGIRILITSIATEKAKYKEMLVNWVVSLCLLFVIHYIMIFAIQIVNTVTELISNAIQKNSVKYYEIEDDKVYDFVEENLNQIEKRDEMIQDTPTQIEGGEEYTTLYINEAGNKTVRYPVDNFLAMARIEMQLLDKNGNDKLASIGWGIIYIMLTLYTVLFSYIYIKRVVYIGFLILVAPLVVLTYSIDKLHDGKAQGFNTWFREYIFNLAIQPFHLLIYIVFVNSAMAFASTNPIYTLIIMGFIIQAEKILRKMFGFEKAATPGVLSGALGAGLAMTGMQKFLGRKPHYDNVKINSNRKSEDSSGESNVNIKEQDVDEILKEEKTILSNQQIKESNLPKLLGQDNSEKEDVKESISEKGKKDLAFEVENMDKEELVRIIASEKSEATKKTKPKFNIKRAIKGATRRYIQERGERFSRRVQNTNLLRSARNILVGGATALTAGTAGIMLGAIEGSPEKALRNAGILGGMGYKGSTDFLNSRDIDGISDSFIKAGYGNEYKQVQKELLAREISHNLENRTKLEEEFGWNREQINNFYENEMNEYIEAGFKNLNDMINAEKLKVNGTVVDTKQAIGVVSLGNIIGNTKKLTDKKRREWAETITNQSSKIKEMREQVSHIQKDYEEQIENIMKMEISEQEMQQKINQVNQKKNVDKQLNKLSQKIKEKEDKVLSQLDAYSKIKYKL